MIPNHRLLRAVARSSRADVWQAEGPRGMVALHIARPGVSLVTQAEGLRRVAHPYIVSLVDYDPGGTWMSTAWVQGVPIDRWTDAADAAGVVQVLSRVAEGVTAIHRHSVAHGDLSPGNILILPDRTPRILDLEPFVPGELGGTAGYLAPERLRGAAPDERSDIYSLGAIAWRCFAGQAPFADDGTAAALTALRALAAPPSSVRPGLPSGIDDLILAMMATNPRARPRPVSRIPELLQRAVLTRPRPPLVGLARPREALRVSLVDLFSGRSGVVVVYGPNGSGRRSLVREAVRAARREGLAAVPLATQEDLARLEPSAPCIATTYDTAPWCAAAMELVARSGRPVLLLVHAERPPASAQLTGARLVSVPPLTLKEGERLVEALGGDPGRAAELMERTGGRPGDIVAAVGTSTPRAAVSPEQRILTDLARGQRSLPELARALDLSEHRLLDHLEPLLDTGRVRDVDGLHVELGG